MESRVIQVHHLQGYIVANKLGLGLNALEELQNKLPSKPVSSGLPISVMPIDKFTTPSNNLEPSPLYNATTDVIADGMRALIPVKARTWLRGTVPPLIDAFTGNTTPPSDEQYPIGPENFTRGDIQNIDQTVQRARKRIQDNDRTVQRARKRTGGSNQGQTNYADYTKTTSKEDPNIWEWDNPISNTLGAFSFEVLPDGRIRVFDKYDSRNERTQPYLNTLDEDSAKTSSLKLLWRDLKTIFKSGHKDFETEKPKSYFKMLFSDPERLFADLAQVTMNVVARNENSAKPIDFIYDPKTFQGFPTPLDDQTKKRPPFGSMAAKNDAKNEQKIALVNRTNKVK